MPKIFICYRREDSNHQAGRLYDLLITYFRSGEVFKDVDSILPGQDFRKVLAEKVGQCDVLLALVGDGWLSAREPSGRRRIDNPADFVRIEIETALHREIPVVPLLVGRAGVPAPEELPPSLQDLAYRHGLPVRPDPDFRNDVGRLVRGIMDSTRKVVPPRRFILPSFSKIVAVPMRWLRAKKGPEDLSTPTTAERDRKSVVEWAWVVIALYCLLLVAFTFLGVLVGSGRTKLDSVPHTVSFWQSLAAICTYWRYWAMIALWLLCQAAMLLVPVRVGQRRPVSRKPLIVPIVTTAFMALWLTLGMTVSAFGASFLLPTEYHPAQTDAYIFYTGLGLASLTWICWFYVFYKKSRLETPEGLVAQMCRRLLKGSIMELLIAVPTHIVARNRDECCAAGITFFGIVMGLPVMFLTFGPGVFFLFLERWKRLRQRQTVQH